MNYLQVVNSIGEPVGGGVCTQNDGRGTYVEGEEKRTGRVQGLRKGGGGRVTGLTPHVTAWESNGKTMDMERRSYGRGGRGRAKDISDRVPQGGGEGVSSGRMPGKGRDKDGDEGAFLETACSGRRDHLGGGKTPSAKMPTMRHASPVADTKWPSQEHSNVQEWDGKEETVTGGGRVKRQRGDGL